MALSGSWKNKTIWVTVFCIAMAYLESSVVVYLRMIYYPRGFQFPLQLMESKIYLIEFGREFATIVMLGAIGFLSGKTLLERFIYFIYSFGVWDIFYYIWLKIFLNWPASFFENDILFLIPVPWIGPVIAPVFISITFIITATWSIYLQGKGYILKVRKDQIVLMILGIILVLVSFMWNAFTINLLKHPNPGFLWGIFLGGELSLIVGIILFLKNKIHE